MVSVVKMATVLEECAAKEQRSIVHLCGQKDSMQRIFIKKYFPFTAGSVCPSVRSAKKRLGGKRFADGEEVETESG
jgi:hypothetical protein